MNLNYLAKTLSHKSSNKLSPHKPSFSRTGPCLRRKTERVPIKKGAQGSNSSTGDDPFPLLLMSNQINKGLGKIHRPSIIPVKPDHNLYRQAKANANLDLMVELFEKSLPESKRGAEKRICVNDELGNQTLEQTLGISQSTRKRTISFVTSSAVRR